MVSAKVSDFRDNIFFPVRTLRPVKPGPKKVTAFPVEVEVEVTSWLPPTEVFFEGSETMVSDVLLFFAWVSKQYLRRFFLGITK